MNKIYLKSITLLITLTIFIMACDEIPQEIVNEVMTVEDNDRVEPWAAAFVIADPSADGTIATNGIIRVIFDNNPGEVTTSSGTIAGSGKTRTINGPFEIGTLSLTIQWENGDGSMTINYTVIEFDDTPPEITGSNPVNGENDVDPGEIFENGIVVTFNESVIGDLSLFWNDYDVGWWSETESDTITLIGFAGTELSNGTEYKIVGIVSDNAGNETEVSITFVTSSPPGPDFVVDGLVSHWRFDDGKGKTATDSSMNSLDGELIGDPKWSFGIFDHALEFDGLDNYVNVEDDTAFDIMDNITIMAWFMPNDPFSNTSLIVKDESFSIGFTNNNQLRFVLQPNDSIINSVGRFQDGEWNHFAVTYNGESMKIYINGALDNEQPYTGPIAQSETDLTIGRGFSGFIDEVKIYNRALIEGEILEFMNYNP